MLVGVIVFITSILGVISNFVGNATIVYIAGILVIIEEIFGVISKQSKGFFIIPISLLLSIGAIFAKVNFFYAFCMFCCFLDVIFFVGGLVYMYIIGKKINNTDKETVDEFIDKTTNELVQKSGLPYELCEDAVCILLMFEHGNILEAKAFIDTSFSIKAKELPNLYQIGIAFGLLVNDNFSQEEATKYTEKIIKEKIEQKD